MSETETTPIGDDLETIEQQLAAHEVGPSYSSTIGEEQVV